MNYYSADRKSNFQWQKKRAFDPLVFSRGSYLNIMTISSLQQQQQNEFAFRV